MDEAELTRVRITISAQRDKNTGTYAGQSFVDMGGRLVLGAACRHTSRFIGLPPTGEEKAAVVFRLISASDE